mmetsp:Transcript_10374/g.17824  ORF Transcript_10374/g.17824 Transcript_10374/m.17824 type:complete len:211 (-) Transcript_10374:144-776(-)
MNPHLRPVTASSSFSSTLWMRPTESDASPHISIVIINESTPEAGHRVQQLLVHLVDETNRVEQLLHKDLVRFVTSRSHAHPCGCRANECGNIGHYANHASMTAGTLLKGLEGDTRSDGDDERLRPQVSFHLLQNSADDVGLDGDKQDIAVLRNLSVGGSGIHSQSPENVAAFRRDVGGGHHFRLRYARRDEAFGQCFAHLARTEKTNALV